ncbi:hypothetical protein PMZ80_010827 [Knufia obscura]|uniref:Uncharacterized protein n=1 Tax=Knufia obscura TaxID=1635080 RepID=A0ABR0R9M3_9EURO|nr:hypothetical protein PMZ80_010827 [Knufia obscura]
MLLSGRLNWFPDRPCVLNLGGITREDGQKADPRNYELKDLAKTLVYYKGGIDGVEMLLLSAETQSSTRKTPTCTLSSSQG